MPCASLICHCMQSTHYFGFVLSHLPPWSRYEMTRAWVTEVTSSLASCLQASIFSLSCELVSEWFFSEKNMRTHQYFMQSKRFMAPFTFGVTCELTTWAHLACFRLLGFCVSSSVHHESAMLSLATTPSHSLLLLLGESFPSFAQQSPTGVLQAPPPGSLTKSFTLFNT